MAKEIKLKRYIKREVVKAIRITEFNFQELQASGIDFDGCLLIGTPKHLYGNWLVVESRGCQLVPNNDFKENYKLLGMHNGKR